MTLSNDLFKCELHCIKLPYKSFSNNNNNLKLNIAADLVSFLNNKLSFNLKMFKINHAKIHNKELKL